MRAWWQRYGGWIKGISALVIVACVGWQFRKLLSDEQLWQQPLTLHPLGVVGVAVLYVLALLLWGSLWVRLLRLQNAPVGTWPGLRAYMVSQLGKYVPGKAWALVVRASMTAREGVRPALAIMTGIYETLTVMVAGLLVAVVLVPLLATERTLALVPGLDQPGILPLVQGVGLVALVLAPLILVRLNRLVRRIADKRLGPDAGKTPPLPLRAFVQGVGRGLLGWLALGTSLWLMLLSVGVAGDGWLWLRCQGYMALAYVCGFVILVAPGGLGVREFLLQVLIAQELAPTIASGRAEGVAVVVVLALRVIWTTAELIVAGGMYVLGRGTAVDHQATAAMNTTKLL